MQASRWRSIERSAGWQTALHCERDMDLVSSANLDVERRAVHVGCLSTNEALAPLGLTSRDALELHGGSARTRLYEVTFGGVDSVLGSRLVRARSKARGWPAEAFDAQVVRRSKGAHGSEIWIRWWRRHERREHVSDVLLLSGRYGRSRRTTTLLTTVGHTRVLTGFRAQLCRKS